MSRSIGVLAISLLCLLGCLTPLSQAQTFSVIHSFVGNDGNSPYGGITIDARGNLYGTAAFGGQYGGGTVYELMRHGSEWNIAVLHNFGSGADGVVPLSRVVFGPDGNLYGTTSMGEGEEDANGTAFKLARPPTPCISDECPWIETILHAFHGVSGGDGAEPYYGDLVFDTRGNIYGTTYLGGLNACLCGTVFRISPTPRGWVESVIYSFGTFGSYPYAGPTIDGSGNLYGTLSSDATAGQVYELRATGTTWSGKSIHGFYDQGLPPAPIGGVAFDNAGNLFGTTANGGSGGGGIIYELSPSAGNWTYQLLYSLTGDGTGPQATLTIGPDGSLYGTSAQGGAYLQGLVFKLTPSPDGWTLTDLHDFTEGDDGASPYGQVALDTQGNVYGTAFFAGPSGNGVVFEITP